MIVTCCRTSDRLSGEKNWPRATTAKTTMPRMSTMKRDGRRILVEEMLQPPERAVVFVLEARDRLVAARQARSRPSPSRPRRHSSRSPPRATYKIGRGRGASALAVRPRSRLAPSLLGLEADQPQQSSMPSAVSIDSTPSTGLSVISVAPVSKKPSRRIDRRHCRRYRRSPRAPSRPSCAGTAGWSRRSRRP